MNQHVITQRGLLLWAATLGLLLGPTTAATLRLLRNRVGGTLADLVLEHNLGVVIFPIRSRQEEGTEDRPLATWEFVLENPWPNQPWHLKPVSRSCGCREGSVLSEEVPPGGQARIRVGLNPSRVLETRREYLIVETNHPNYRTVACIVKAMLLPEIAWKGATRIQLTRREKPVQQVTVLYHSRSPTPPEPFVLSADSPQVRVELLQSLLARRLGQQVWQHARRYRISLDAQATDQLHRQGNYSCTLVARCGEKSDTLRVTFTIPPAVRIVPEALYLGHDEAQIEVIGAAPLQVDTVEGPTKLLAWRVEPSSDRKIIRVFVQKRSVLKTDSHEQAHGQDQDRMSVASLRLHFSRPEELTVTVPVYVVGQ